MNIQLLHSTQIRDTEIIDRCVSDPNFPYLVSFPRTGSHWLRLIMELYFEKPALIRSFYYKDALEFTCFHQHDFDLKLKRNRVIYLFRDPVHTVFSQLKYYKEDYTDTELISYWAMQYRKHLVKWLIEEKFTNEKLVLRYEDLSKSLEICFKSLSAFIGVDYDNSKLKRANYKVTKNEVKNRTPHDPQVVDVSGSYKRDRCEFSQDFTELVLDTVCGNDSELNMLLHSSSLE